MDIELKAVMTRENGDKLYREEHGFYNLTDAQAASITDAVNKHADHLQQLMDHQNKKPSEVLKAVLSMTGTPDLIFEGMTFDTFQKALQAWNKVGNDLVQALEKELKKA